MEKREKIKLIRKYYNMSQDELGQRIGTSRVNITNIELGNASPTPMLCNCLLAIFSVDKAWFMDDENEDTDVGKYILDTAILEKIRKLDKDFQDYVAKDIDMLIEIQEKRKQ